MNFSEAELARQAAGTIEECTNRLARMFEPGYGGAALQLIELLEATEVRRGKKESAERVQLLRDIADLANDAIGGTHPSEHDELNKLVSDARAWADEIEAAQ